MHEMKVFHANRSSTIYGVVRLADLDEVQRHGVTPGWDRTCNWYHEGASCDRPCQARIHFVSHQIATDLLAQRHLCDSRYALLVVNPKGLRGAVHRVTALNACAPFLLHPDPREPIAPNCLDLIQIFDAAPVNVELFPNRESAVPTIRMAADATSAYWRAFRREWEYRECLESHGERLQTRADVERGYLDFLERMYSVEQLQAEPARPVSDGPPDYHDFDDSDVPF